IEIAHIEAGSIFAACLHTRGSASQSDCIAAPVETAPLEEKHLLSWIVEVSILPRRKVAAAVEVAVANGLQYIGYKRSVTRRIYLASRHLRAVGRAPHEISVLLV